MKATKGRAAEVQSAAKARENDSAPGVQPEAPSRAIHTYREVRGNTLMTNSAMTATAPSTQDEQRAPHCADTPRTWTFTNSETGQPVTVTCMQGCAISHEGDIATPTHPVDIFCWTDTGDDVTLPIDCTGTPEDYRVLATRIEVDPFSQTVAHRLPYAVVEVIDEHYISGLDPDSLQVVINTLAGRLDAMRRTHTELVRVRAEYAEREACIERHVDRIIAAISTPAAEVQA